MKHDPLPRPRHERERPDVPRPRDRRTIHPGWCQCRRCDVRQRAALRLDLFALGVGLAVSTIAITVAGIAINVPAVARALGF